MSLSDISNKKSIYSGLDVFKFICSVLIVILHCTETSKFIPCEFKYVLTSMAVPFFFVTSGFLFGKKVLNTANDKEYFFSYIKRLFIMYGFWCIVFSPLGLKEYISKYRGESKLKLFFVLFRNYFVKGNGVFWYVLALIFAITFIYFCYKIRNNRGITLLSIAIAGGFILLILYTCFHNTLSATKFIQFWDFVYGSKNNFIMHGIPFTGIGFLIAIQKIRIFNMKKSILFFVISTLFCVFEYNLVLIFKEISLFSTEKIEVFFVFQAVFLFMIALNYKPNIKYETSKTLRQASSFIYYIHAYVIYNLVNVVLKSVFNAPIYAGWFIPIKVICTLFVCLTLFFIIKKINNKHLNFLINA